MWEGLKDPWKSGLSHYINARKKSGKKEERNQERKRESVLWQCSGSRKIFWKKYIHDSLKFIPFSRILRFNSSKNIKCFFRNLKRFQTFPLAWGRLNRQPWGFCEFSLFSTPHRRDALAESVFRISRKIIIETSLKHLMFVRKHQAILKQVWSCSERIPRAWAYSRGRFSEYCSPELHIRRSLCFSRKSKLIEYLARQRLFLLRHRDRNF